MAILARNTDPVITRRQLPGDSIDKQSRYIEAAVKGVLIACIYLPNGNPQPGPKFDYKLAWFERLIAHADTLLTTEAPVVLAGDFNVVPTDFDIYPTTSWAKDALVQPAPPACFQRLLDQGWVDAIRTLHPLEPMFTFWDYKRERWQRDAGLRLDHLLLNRTAADTLTNAGVNQTIAVRMEPAIMLRHGYNLRIRSNGVTDVEAAVSVGDAARGVRTRPTLGRAGCGVGMNMIGSSGASSDVQLGGAADCSGPSLEWKCDPSDGAPR